jgi:tetratricopeptide (TPR) repeat protein
MGSAIGTPAYMSPEQAAGRWDVVAQASDTYSLGAVLYTVLTGRPPLEKGNWPEMQQRIQRGDFPRPRQVKPDVPLPLEAACLKAMALDPPARYASAEALAADVEHWMADEPVAAYRDSLAAHARRWMRNHRTLVSAGAMLLVTALVAAGAGLVLIGQKNREVADERNAARAAAEEATAVNAFLTDDLLGQADPDQNDRDKKVTVEEVLAKAAAKIDGNPKFAGKPQVEATLRLAVGKTYVRLGNLAEAERHLRGAVDVRRAHLPPDDPRTLVAQEALADCLAREENFAEAEPLSRQTWEARQRVLGPTHRDTLDSLDTHATAMQGLGRTDEALVLMRECLDGRRKALGSEDSDTLGSMNNLSVILTTRGQWVEANVLLREVVEIKERTGVDFEGFAPAGNLGLNLYYLGDLDEAEKILARYAERAARQLGPENVATQFLRAFLARVWVEQGKADRAVAALHEIIAVRRKDFPKGSWRTASYLVDVGRANLSIGRPDEAAATLTEARQMYRVFPPQTAYHAPWADACYGAALVGLQKYAEAEPILLAAEGRLRGLAVCPRRHYRQTVEELVKLYEGWNKPAEAAKWRKQRDLPGKGT